MMETEEKERRIEALGVLLSPRFTPEQDTSIRARIQWVGHKHGVVVNVAKADENLVAYWIKYHYGEKAAWWTRASRGFRSVEFYYNVDSPRGTRPWHYDGTTILFQDWMQEEQGNRARRKQLLDAGLKMGARVKFNWKGAQKIGTYAGGQTYASVVTGGLKYHIVWDDIIAFTKEN
jgi:hypothetical protein